MFPHVLFQCMCVPKHAHIANTTRHTLAIIPHQVSAAVRCPDHWRPLQQVVQGWEIPRVGSVRPETVECQLVLGRTTGTTSRWCWCSSSAAMRASWRRGSCARFVFLANYLSQTTIILEPRIVSHNHRCPVVTKPNGETEQKFICFCLFDHYQSVKQTCQTWQIGVIYIYIYIYMAKCMGVSRKNSHKNAHSEFRSGRKLTNMHKYR